jgi:hypothetical protein
MKIRFIGPLLCGGLLALAVATDGHTQAAISRPGDQIDNRNGNKTTPAQSRSNTGDRIGGDGFTSVIVPTDSRDVTRNGLVAGSGPGGGPRRGKISENENPRPQNRTVNGRASNTGGSGGALGLTGIVPTVEGHVNGR